MLSHVIFLTYAWVLTTGMIYLRQYSSYSLNAEIFSVKLFFSDLFVAQQLQLERNPGQVRTVNLFFFFFTL